MPFSDESYNLRINLDTQNCSFSAGDLEEIERSLRPLREQAKSFPISDLYITIAHPPRSNDYIVRIALVLTGRTLFTAERADHMHPAMERCINKLIHQMQGYQDALQGKTEQAKLTKGTRQDVHPAQAPDGPQIEEAVAEGDYAAFRDALFSYEEPVHKRIGRWIARYPDLESQLGSTILLSEIAEEVFLNAFERWEERPRNVSLSEWLEGLIDPSIKALLEDPAAERENIAFAQSLRTLRGQTTTEF